ncbi:MAG: site-specific DNA-methyltransferase [Chromatiales bacterium]|nr:site-specific DNA-methyltransferase [Chromatiales bacterium]
MIYSDSRKEKRFLDALESLFTGAEVEGDSGFVNLMCIKRNYFRSIRPELMENIKRRATPNTAFREELFDKLYTFFHRYFCDSGSIYFRHLPAFSKIYERVYQDGQDVALSWKTQMLYYVKSDVLVHSMPVELRDADKSYSTQHFYFDVSECTHKRNNERREFIYAFDKVKKEGDKQVICLKVGYKEGNKKSQTEEIIRESRKQKTRLTEDELQKAISVFRKQTEVDFFINKDARRFLQEQFNLWLYQYIFEGTTHFDAERIQQLQAIKDTAYEIIDFIAQFEDELRRIWEKPKFVRNVNYVVTLDKLSDKVLQEIVKHKGVKAQIKEWHELGIVDNQFLIKDLFNGQRRIDDTNKVGSQYKFLPLDTRHFKDLELEILACLGNLDEALDGELVHSENWQALNTLQRRYKEQVKCIYIDPPYNTSSSEIVYKNSYKHSSFLCLIENRVHLSKSYLSSNGIMEVAIDDEEMEYLGILFKSIFESNNHVGNISIMSNPGGRSDAKHLAAAHDYCLLYAKDIQKLETSKFTANKDVLEQTYNKRDSLGKYKEVPFRRTGSNSTRQARPNLYYPLFWNPKSKKLSTKREQKSDIEILPIDDSGKERIWRWGKETLQSKLKTEIIVKERKDNCVIYVKDRIKQEIMPKSIWVDSKYDASSHGTILLKKMFSDDFDKFSYPKSLNTVKDSLVIGANSHSIILDYFAGSGTTAHAIINLNQEDGGNRKYLLVEMGEYFHTVLLPRIKKVVYSKDWNKGKPVSCEGSSHCLKYYSLEQYEETLRNARYEDGEQLELDSAKSPFEQYVFFADDKLSHIVKPLTSGKLKINLKSLCSDIDIAESLANILGKHIRRRTADSVTFADGSVEKINPTKMDKEEQIHFISLLKPYLWWGNA